MKNLGTYKTLANAYNNSVSVFKIADSVDDGQNLIIDNDEIQMTMDVTDGDVTEIKIVAKDAGSRDYMRTFQGFEFGMNWEHPSFIGSYMKASATHNEHFEGSNGFAHYDAIIDDAGQITVTLTPEDK
jgi:hypothetical protein